MLISKLKAHKSQVERIPNSVISIHSFIRGQLDNQTISLIVRTVPKSGRFKGHRN